MATLLRELSKELSKSSSRNNIVGLWQDLKGEFFNGSVIEISADGTWKPQILNQRMDITASYTWRRLSSSPTEWELLQVRKDPRTERSYVVTLNDTQLSVHLSGNESLRWRLDQHDPERSATKNRVAAATEKFDAERWQMRESRRNSLEISFKRKMAHHVTWKGRFRSVLEFFKSEELVDKLIFVAVIVNSIVLGWFILVPEDHQNLSSRALNFAVQAFGLVTLGAALVAQANVLKLPDARGTERLSVVIFYYDMVMLVLGIMETCLSVILQIVPLWRIRVIFVCLECLRFVRLFHLLRISKKWLHPFIDAMGWLVLSGCLLLLLLYILGVLCTRFIGHSDRFNENIDLQIAFYTLGDSMFTLFSFCTFEDWTKYLRHTMREGPYGKCITLCIIAFMFVANLTIFNVAAAAMVRITDEMQARTLKRRQERYEEHLEHLLFQSGQEIARDDFFERLAPFCVDEGAFSSLEANELFDLIDTDGSGKLSREELLDGLAVLRTSSATSKQLFGLDKKMQNVFKSLGLDYKTQTDKLNQANKTLDALLDMVKNLQDEMGSFFDLTRSQVLAGHSSTENSEASSQAVKLAESQQYANGESLACVQPPPLVSTTSLKNILDSFKGEICADLRKCMGHHAELSDGRRADEYRQLLESVDTRLLKVVTAVPGAAETSPTPNGVAHTDILKQHRLSTQPRDTSASASFGEAVQQVVETSPHAQVKAPSYPSSASNSFCQAQIRTMNDEGIASMQAEINFGATRKDVAHTEVSKQHRSLTQLLDAAASTPLGGEAQEAVETSPHKQIDTHCPTSICNSPCEAQRRVVDAEGNSPMQAEIHCGATPNGVTHADVAKQDRLLTRPSDVSASTSLRDVLHSAVETSPHEQVEAHSYATSANNSLEAQPHKVDAGGIPYVQAEIHRGATSNGIAQTGAAKLHRLSTPPLEISTSTSLRGAVHYAAETSPHTRGETHARPIYVRASSFEAQSPEYDARGIPFVQANIHCAGAQNVVVAEPRSVADPFLASQDASKEQDPSTSLRPKPPPLNSFSADDWRFQLSADAAVGYSALPELPGAALENGFRPIAARCVPLDGERARMLGEMHQRHHHSSRFAMTPPPRAAVVGKPARSHTAMDLGLVSPPHVRPCGMPPAVIALAPFVGTPNCFGQTGRIAGLEKWVVEHRLSAVPFDKLVLHLDAQGVELSTSEQDYLKHALSHRNI